MVKALAHEVKYHVGDNGHGAPPLTLIVTQSPTLARDIRTQEYPKMRRRIMLRFRENGEKRVARKLQQSMDNSSSLLPQCLDDVEGVGSFAASFSEFLRVVDRSIGDGEYFFDTSDFDGSDGGGVYYLMDRLALTNNAPAARKNAAAIPGAVAAGNQARFLLGREVTYARFKSEYWSRYLRASARGFTDDYMVFREILVIKAGRTRQEGAKTELGKMRFDPLSRADYIGGKVSLESAKTLAEAERAQIYDLFELYQKQLAVPRTRSDNGGSSDSGGEGGKTSAGSVKLREWDMADCVNNIFRRWSRKKIAGGMQSTGFHGRQITSMNVDETQDLLSRQIRLLTCFVGDLQAFCIAADTAQAIEHGRSFSFASLKDEVLSGAFSCGISGYIGTGKGR